jgi:hypothetical protein
MTGIEGIGRVLGHGVAPREGAGNMLAPGMPLATGAMVATGAIVATGAGLIAGRLAPGSALAPGAMLPVGIDGHGVTADGAGAIDAGATDGL